MCECSKHGPAAGKGGYGCRHVCVDGVTFEVENRTEAPGKSARGIGQLGFDSGPRRSDSTKPVTEVQAGDGRIEPQPRLSVAKCGNKATGSFVPGLGSALESAWSTRRTKATALSARVVSCLSALATLLAGDALRKRKNQNGVVRAKQACSMPYPPTTLARDVRRTYRPAVLPSLPPNPPYRVWRHKPAGHLRIPSPHLLSMTTAGCCEVLFSPASRKGNNAKRDSAPRPDSGHRHV
jgi:hypothetical protein